MSSDAELLIYLGAMAAVWAIYVVRKVRRERRNSSGLSGHADAYDGNLVIPPGNGGHHGTTGMVLASTGTAESAGTAAASGATAPESAGTTQAAVTTERHFTTGSSGLASYPGYATGRLC